MTTQAGKLTISLPTHLISFVNEVKSEENISRSKVISDCLSEFARKRKIQLMEEGYKTMANENREFARLAFELQRKVVLRQE